MDHFNDSLTIDDESPGQGWLPTGRQIREFANIIKAENDLRDGISADQPRATASTEGER